jgi:hypothetical protein
VVKRHLPAAKRAKELMKVAAPVLLPASWRGPGGSTEFGGPVPDDLRPRVAELLHDDVAALRSYLRSDWDGWGIA